MLAGADGPDPYFVSDSFAVVAGQVYEISADIVSAGGTPFNNNYIRLKQAGSGFGGAVGVNVSTSVTGNQRAIVTIPAGWTSAEVAVQRGGNPVPPTTTLEVDNISVKKISSHAAIAPSDSARPTLATENSPISSREVLTTTFGWNITDGGRA
jgi:hypothetical protein